MADLLSGDTDSVRFFEQAIGNGADAVAVANWLVHEVRGAGGAEEQPSKLEPEALAGLVSLVEEDVVSRAVAKQILQRLVESGGDPREIVEEEGLGQISDAGELGNVVRSVIEEHPDEVDRFRGGQVGLAGFFVGQVMRATEGRADPALVRELVEESLK